MYTEKVMDHFANPRNVGVLENPTVIAKIGDPDCGDFLVIFLRIENDRIADIKYKIHGCGAAIATSSIASEMVMGMPLDEVLRVTDQDIADALDGLPEEKMHCSNLAAGALHSAITRYREFLAQAAQKQMDDPGREVG